MTAERSRLCHFVALVVATVGFGGAASADPITIDARLVNEIGAPITGMELRVVVGSEPDARGPLAGRRLVTDAEGRVTYSVESTVPSRSVALDFFLFRHPARTIDVGIEMELVGRQALYWITLDLVRDGTVGGIAAYVQGVDGRFDRGLDFHPRTHSFSFPDDPGGMLMSGIGVELRHHEMSGQEDGPWRVELLIEKQTFQIR